MFRNKLALTLAGLVVLSGLAVAHDGKDRRDDDWGRYGDRNSARQHGYDYGYRDGLNHGRADRYRNAGYDYRDRDYKKGERGYQRWMGPKGQFKQGYREGYKRGYDQAYNGRRGPIWGGPVWGGGGDRDHDGDVDEDDRGYGRDDRYSRGAYNDGYGDGLNVGRYDRQNRSPYDLYGNAWYRKGHGPGDRPYEDTGDYQRQYREGFAQGYNQGYRR